LIKKGEDNLDFSSKMAGRPWRTAGFADLRDDNSDLRDNNNDVEMPDARAGVSRLPHSSRHQRERIYGVTPRPPPSTPDVRAMAKVEGISVDFRTEAEREAEKPPAKPASTGGDTEKNGLYLNGIVTYSKDESANAREFLVLLDTLRWFPKRDTSVATPLNPRGEFRISFSDLLSPKAAWTAMKVLMYNFHKNAAFKAALENTPQSRVKEIVAGIVEKKYLRILGETKRLFGPEAEFDIQESGKNIKTSEKREMESPLNVFELKSIIDAINVATANIRNEVSLRVDVTKHEPPFYPRLAEDERMMVWNWVNIKQKAIEAIYKDAFYKFATLVAGMVNLTGFGVDKLITSAFRQTPTFREYQQMPSTIADDPFLSAERDALFGKIVSLNEQLRKSKIRDGLRQQQVNNKRSETGALKVYEPRRLPGVGAQKEADNKEMRTFYADVYEATIKEQPADGAELYPMDQEHPKSDETRELELHVHALEGLTDAFVSENSRQRMLWAVKWMMQPEILKKAEIEPIFASAMAQALYRVRQMCQSLRDVTDAKMFYESPDSMVVTAFAELVAQQITRTQFFHQTRVMLDKTHDRNQQMEGRLKWTMQKFRFNGTHVLSEFSSTSSSSTCSALYAF
jgi:hypothetical protein